LKKIKLKALSVVLCSIMSVSLFAASVYASNLNIHNVTAQKQEKNFWCWAAVSSMAAKYLGVSNASQSNIVKTIYSWDFNTTGTVNDANKALRSFGIDSVVTNSRLGYNNVVYDIDNYSTVLAFVQLKNDNNEGHAYLIRGYYSSKTSENIYYIDPREGTYHVKPYEEFWNNDSWRWVDTVKNIKLR
jgi:hypothetical protein